MDSRNGRSSGRQHLQQHPQQQTQQPQQLQQQLQQQQPQQQPQPAGGGSSRASKGNKRVVASRAGESSDGARGRAGIGPCGGRGQGEFLRHPLKALLGREVSAGGNHGFKRSRVQHKFQNFKLTSEYDTFDAKAVQHQRLSFLKRRSRIVEIVAARDMLFALAHSGACAAVNLDTRQRICFLNTSPEEVIRSLFYNKNNDSLISVSVYAADNFSSLKCRTTPLEYIRRGKPDAGFPLFETESLRWPGFVEFDDVNGKVLTYSAEQGVYKVFDLKNYNQLYEVRDRNIQEIKISPGIMLLIYNRSPGHVPLRILNIEDGVPLKSFTHMLHRTKKIDFIEQFNEKLLVKQENENLQILDVRTSLITEVCRTEFMTPSAFIFLYENQLFLTFRNRRVAVWNFKGEMVTTFEDHMLWYPDCNTNNIYITSEQDLILSYCKREDQPEAEVGSINVSNILTGKLVAKITHEGAEQQQQKQKQEQGGKRPRVDVLKRAQLARQASLPLLSPPLPSSSSQEFLSAPKEALEDVTALFFDEDRNEIYTGNRNGLVHVWSN